MTHIQDYSVFSEGTDNKYRNTPMSDEEYTTYTNIVIPENAANALKLIFEKVHYIPMSENNLDYLRHGIYLTDILRTVSGENYQKLVAIDWGMYVETNEGDSDFSYIQGDPVEEGYIPQWEEYSPKNGVWLERVMESMPAQRNNGIDYSSYVSQNGSLEEATAFILEWLYDGSHHLQWTIDQFVRLVTGENYDQLIKDLPFAWNQGIAP